MNYSEASYFDGAGADPVTHPATHPTPDWRAVRAVRMARNLDAYAKAHRGMLHLFLAECASLEMAGRAQVRRAA